ncbi:MAG: RnfABCDGE type electron transport complex subunit G [Bacillota bacterium]
MAATVDGKNIVKPAIVLLLVSAVAAMCLGVVSEVTAEPIAIQEKKALDEGMMAVMPSAASFEELVDIETSGSVSAAYKADGGGFVVVTNPNGFNGALGVMVGVGADGAITGLRVTSHAETPGLGAKATEPAFYEQFTGATGEILVTKDGGEIDSITSSTITSRAVAVGATDAVAWVAANGGAY